MRRALIAIAAATLATQAGAGEIAERVRAPVSFTLHSAKAPVDLEYCVGDVLSALGSVAALRDGPNRSIVQVTGGGNKVVAAVELNGAPGGTQVVGHIFGRGFDDRMRDRATACL